MSYDGLVGIGRCSAPMLERRYVFQVRSSVVKKRRAVSITRQLGSTLSLPDDRKAGEASWGDTYTAMALLRCMHGCRTARRTY